VAQALLRCENASAGLAKRLPGTDRAALPLNPPRAADNAANLRRRSA